MLLVGWGVLLGDVWFGEVVGGLGVNLFLSMVFD